jgi:[CysO sulfur-carrier protein]-S-L-cysteine hydrolase
VIVAPDELAEIRRHAEADYPRECCGVVLTRGTERLLLRCENDQDALHAQDPRAHRRDALSAYHIKEALQIYRRCEAEGFQVGVIYHSHCNAGAYFSETDKRSALFQGEPAFRDAAYVVVSVMSECRLPRWLWRRLPRRTLGRLRRRVVAAAGFRWDADRRDFLGVELGGRRP